MIEILKDKKEQEEYLSTLVRRGTFQGSDVLKTVEDILAEVQEHRDEALLSYTHRFDHPTLTKEELKLNPKALKDAYEALPAETQELLKEAKDRIMKYHQHQLRKTWTYEEDEGEILGQKITPLSSVGIYVPGGKASYPSSVFMNALPAKVAGVERIVMVTPPSMQGIHPIVLACAYLAGVNEVYQVGGAQAIAALAYGTETIQRVDKIVGPGNIYVALAKKCVYGVVGIDSIAGPSEILILADDTANPQYIAADLLAQAEHDECASANLITNSMKLAKAVQVELKKFYAQSTRQKILDQSLEHFCRILIQEEISDMISLANEIAPEHLEVCLEEPFSYVDQIKNAGALFLGNYTPESFGDYMAGPNHVLPTVQTARFFSPLGVDDFIKKTSILSFSKEAAAALAHKVDAFARLEGLEMHALSAKLRGEGE